jgi:acyl-coenzyme A thioesterase PaaI-like protein
MLYVGAEDEPELASLIVAARADVTQQRGYVSSARGERLVAHGRVVKPGRRLTVCAGEAYGDGGPTPKTIATMLGTMAALAP